jgi:ASC-1-like (ASCH) protein
MDYKHKYSKYKTKYLALTKSQHGGKKLKNKTVKSYNKYNNKYIPDTKMEPKYSEHLSEPWFSLISLGLKTVEGRLNKGRFQEMQVGDIIEFHNEDFLERKILTKVTGKTEYKSFTEYLETEGLGNCLPGIPSLAHSLSVYYKYFTKEKEAEFGVVAIRFELI